MTEPVANILEDRRRALRVQLRSDSSLITADGSCEAHLLNLSESGALLAVLEDHQLVAGEAISIEIALPGAGTACMEGHIAHIKDHLLGLDCTPAADEDARKIEAVIDQLTQADDTL